MNRLEFRDWAKLGFVVDPDLDTTHPLVSEGGPFEGILPYEHGWMFFEGGDTNYTWQKMPNEWYNYILRQNEGKLEGIAEGGIAGWHSETTYKEGAFATGSDGLIYRSKVPTNVGADPVSSEDEWEVSSMNDSSDGVLQAIQAFLDDLNAHKDDQENPHEVHASNFVNAGGVLDPAYTEDEAREEIDKVEIASHVALTNPHNNTAVMVGALPSTGGKFTGGVHFKETIHGEGKEIHTTGNEFRLTSGDDYLSVKAEGIFYKESQVITDSTFKVVRTRNEPDFALPEPEAVFTLSSSLSQPNAGAYTLEYLDGDTDTPTFEDGMLVLEDGASLIVDMEIAGHTARYDLGCVDEPARISISEIALNSILHVSFEAFIDDSGTNQTFFHVTDNVNPAYFNVLAGGAKEVSPEWGPVFIDGVEWVTDTYPAFGKWATISCPAIEGGTRVFNEMAGSTEWGATISGSMRNVNINNERFYPIDDGWENNPVIRDTVGGEHGEAINFQEEGWLNGNQTIKVVTNNGKFFYEEGRWTGDDLIEVALTADPTATHLQSVELYINLTDKQKAML